jgi:hypothetical protein
MAIGERLVMPERKGWHFTYGRPAHLVSRNDSGCKVRNSDTLLSPEILTATLSPQNGISVGSPHWNDTELVFEKKGLIPALQRLLAKNSSHTFRSSTIIMWYN